MSLDRQKKGAWLASVGSGLAVMVIDGIGIAGAAAIVRGVYLISEPWAYIIGGLIASGAAALISYRRGK